MRALLVGVWLGALSACSSGSSVQVAPGDAGMDAGADAGTDAGSDAGEFGTSVPGDSLGLEADPPGTWLAGDLHVHSTGASNDTGGDSTPEEIARVARERGLFFVVLTDHSNATGSDPTTTAEDPALFNMGPEFPYWDRVAALSEPGRFLMVDGNELSPVADGDRPTEPRGHIGCVPADLATFDRSGAFTDRPRGAVTGGECLAQARARGCFSVLNHPYGTPWTSYDWTDMGYVAMEVWNGTAGLDAFDRAAHAAWRCDLLAGRHVTPIGASDNHRVHQAAPGELLNPALGFPSTSVLAREPTWPAIVEGLRAGRVAIHEGESLALLDGYGADLRHAEDASMRWIRVRGGLDARGGRARLRLVHTIGCDDPRPSIASTPAPVETLLLERVIEPGARYDLAVAVAGAPGVYTAVLTAPASHWSAMSRAIAVAR